LIRCQRDQRASVEAPVLVDDLPVNAAFPIRFAAAVTIALALLAAYVPAGRARATDR
jgi:hypothetical protein